MTFSEDDYRRYKNDYDNYGKYDLLDRDVCDYCCNEHSRCSCDDDYRKSDEDDYCSFCYDDYTLCRCHDYPDRCVTCGKVIDDRHEMCYRCYKKKVWETYKVLKRLGRQYQIALRIWQEAGFTRADLRAIRSNGPCYRYLKTGKCNNPLCLYRHTYTRKPKRSTVPVWRKVPIFP